MERASRLKENRLVARYFGNVDMNANAASSALGGFDACCAKALHTVTPQKTCVSKCETVRAACPE